jgi:hypothetical protein
LHCFTSFYIFLHLFTSFLLVVKKGVTFPVFMHIFLHFVTFLNLFASFLLVVEKHKKRTELHRWHHWAALLARWLACCACRAGWLAVWLSGCLAGSPAGQADCLTGWAGWLACWLDWCRAAGFPEMVPGIPKLKP